MVIDSRTTPRYIGLSTDPKPQGANGSLFLEIDTGKAFLYDSVNEEWHDAPARQRYATLSGSVVSFSNGAAAPVKSLTAAIEPVQSGSGDPSPDNVRPISGWTAANVWVKATHDTESDPTHTIDLGRTVYGGSLDVTTGVLTVTMAKIHLAASAFTNWFPVYNQAYTGEIVTNAKYDSSVKSYICDTFKPIANNNRTPNIGNFVCLVSSGKAVAASSPADTLEGFKALIPNGIDLVYELATPQTYQLTPTEVTTLLGDNCIWADTGDVEVVYRVG